VGHDGSVGYPEDEEENAFQKGEKKETAETMRPPYQYLPFSRMLVRCSLDASCA
jgi:hypothetical protein